MRKLFIIVILLIIVLNAIVILPNLCSKADGEEECKITSSKIELKEVQPMLIPSLLKF